MKTYVCWLVCGLCLVLAGFCSAADSISIPLDCKGLQASGAVLGCSANQQSEIETGIRQAKSLAGGQ